MEQEIKFCTTTDSVRIAYSSVGNGPPFVKAANWMNHLEYDWQSPVWSHLLHEFASDHQLIRYDERGTGLSDRDVEDLSLDAFVDDLSAVIDAVGVERFPLFGISQGGPVAVAYANRHPEKVSHLILLGSFVTGWKKAKLSPDDLEKRQAQVTLIKQGWNSKNPAIRQLWTTLCIPEANPEEARSFNDLQQASVSPDNAARIFEAIGDLDVNELLPKLNVPTLVLHSRGDALVPFEEGRRLASLIPNSRFVTLESNNHLLLQHEAAWPVFVTEVRKFLGREKPAEARGTTTRLFRTCPTCSRTYADAEMIYCLDDGTKLTGMETGLADDGANTMILNSKI
ncbi:MAG: alpha/beta fold hydrolase [Pyrinomonadaceae bacterium]